MGDRTGIEWTDASWTPIRAKLLADTASVGWHCEHVSEGCRNCYAEAMNRRLGTGLDFKPGHRRDVETILDEKLLLQPLRWKRSRLIFVCSMTDLFADFVTDDFIDRMFAVMALCPQHTFQVLTKRPARMRAYFADEDLGHRIETALGCMLDGDWIWNEGKPHRRRIEMLITAFLGAPVSEDDDDDDLRELADAAGYLPDPLPLPNVWLGTSVEDQAAADARIPELLATPAAVRFLSCEPLLGPVDIRWALSHPLDIAAGFLARGQFSPGLETLRRLDWAIGGGESGRNARPLHPDWVRSLRDQCAAAAVPFLLKQWGEFVPCQTDHDGERLVVYEDGADCPAFASDKRHPIITAHGREFWRLGKKAAGRLLDGVLHDGRPS